MDTPHTLYTRARASGKTYARERAPPEAADGARERQAGTRPGRNDARALGSVEMARTGIELDLGIRSECVGCGSERELEGRLVAQGERITVVEASEPCECGETRVKVTVDVEEASQGSG